MQSLNEADIRAWIKEPGHHVFKYGINSKGLSYLSLIGAALLGVGLLVWVWSDWNREMLTAAIIVVGGLNALIWWRIASSIWFVARNMVGISSSELIIIRGYKGTLISFNELREDSIGWNESPPMGAKSELPIRIGEETIVIELVGFYYALEHHAAFLGKILETMDEYTVVPRDAI